MYEHFGDSMTDKREYDIALAESIKSFGGTRGIQSDTGYVERFSVLK